MIKSTFTITFFLTLFAIFFTTSVLAQNENNETATQIDSILAEDASHMLMASISFSTNDTKNKNYLDLKMPTLMGDIYFFEKSGFWTSISYTTYIDASENTNETEVSIGYQKYFGAFDIDFSYKWHHFQGDTLYTGIDYEHGFSLSTGLDLDFINFYVDNSVLLGESNNYFLDLSLGFNLEGDHIFSKNDNISLSPTILSSFGTNDFIYYDIIPRQKKFRGKIYDLPPQIIENSESKFIYQSIGFIVPIIYSIGDISLSFAWSYIIPSEQLKELEWSDQNGFFVSLTYIPNIFQ